jgi:hypothetical protein
MEFIGVSTDSQHSSQQQGLALSLESNLKRKKDLLLLKLWLWIFPPRTTVNPRLEV